MLGGPLTSSPFSKERSNRREDSRTLYSRARENISKDSAHYLRFALNGCGSLMRPSDHATQKSEPAR